MSVPEFETTENNDKDFQLFLGRGEVRLQKCSHCGHPRYPARWICPECLSEKYEWQPVRGTALVECFVWYMRSFDSRFAEVPYNVALVRLDEGPRLITNVLGVEFGQLSVGQQVQTEICEGPNRRLILNFRPSN
jgi:hypothetical protein